MNQSVSQSINQLINQNRLKSQANQKRIEVMRFAPGEQ